MNIAGDWFGEIIMGKAYRQYEGQVLRFELSLEQQGSTIKGSSQDVGGFGVNPKPATVIGDIRGLTLSFTKRYPTLQVVVKDDVRTYDNVPGPEILYVGIFDEINQQFTGHWTLSMKVRIWKIIPWAYKAKGTWNMRRIASAKGRELVE